MTESTRTHGKICYLIMPSVNAEASAAFYEGVFGWQIRGRDSGELSFDDTTGAVSGMWDTGLQPRSGGYEVDIMVDDVEAAGAKVIAAGGTLIGEMQVFGQGEHYQKFADPDGNELGLYHSDQDEK